jgi:hypothetical protein
MFFCFCLLFSCSQPKKISSEIMFAKISKVEGKIQIMSGHDPLFGPQPTCKDYDVGCKNVYRMKIKNIPVIYVEFFNFQQAKANAEKLGAYWYYNWMIDDVVEEPLLEAIIKKAYGEEQPENHDKH